MQPCCTKHAMGRIRSLLMWNSATTTAMFCIARKAQRCTCASVGCSPRRALSSRASSSAERRSSDSLLQQHQAPGSVLLLFHSQTAKDFLSESGSLKDNQDSKARRPGLCMPMHVGAGCQTWASQHICQDSAQFCTLICIRSLRHIGTSAQGRSCTRLPRKCATHY